MCLQTSTLIQVDVDENPAASEWAQVQAMPTFVIYKKGVKVDEVRGADAKKLEAVIRRYA